MQVVMKNASFLVLYSFSAHLMLCVKCLQTYQERWDEERNNSVRITPVTQKHNGAEHRENTEADLSDLK